MKNRQLLVICVEMAGQRIKKLQTGQLLPSNMASVRIKTMKLVVNSFVLLRK